ncbi:Ubiquitin-conjugating enzyme E2-20 kDa [Escovopsis weberi]|uniref:Ubiquitin-conjugating enzyme E2 2 n=1 Tax=Escovopsis weberi TaxID=150374 RepID=A0A0M9VTL8_ESCWE|nr:Ubiquitin-conjugating enzyme E2-20 kDa [Escovopsis weberi]
MEYSQNGHNAPGDDQATKPLNRKAAEAGSVTKRLQTELMTLMTSPAPGVSAFPSADGDLMSWTGTIEGPDDTPYSGLTLKLSFAFPPTYPYAPPTVLFKTPIYHPNVDFSGRICLDILKDKWTAAYNVQTILLSLQSLLGEPNKLSAPVHVIVSNMFSSADTLGLSASPLNGEAAELWDKDFEEFKRKVLARHVDIEEE